MKVSTPHRFLLKSSIVFFIIVVLFLKTFPLFNQFVIRLFLPTFFIVIFLTKFNWTLKSLPKEFIIYLFFIVWANIGIINVVYDPISFYSYVQNLIGILLCILVLLLLSKDLRSSEYIHLGLAINAGLALFDAILFSDDAYFSDGRLGGIYGNSNVFSFVLVTGVFSLYLYRTFNKGKLVNFFLRALEIFLLYGIILAASRKSVIIMLMFYILLWVSLYAKKRLLISSLILLLFLPLLFIIDSVNLVPSGNLSESIRVVDRLSDNNLVQKDAGTRQKLITDGFILIEKFPVFGGGLGNYKYYTDRGGYAHNDLMELTATTGIVGLLIYLLIYRVLVNRIRKYVKLVGRNRSTVLIYIFLFLFFLIGMGMPHFIEWQSMIFLSSLIMYFHFKLREINVVHLS